MKSHPKVGLLPCAAGVSDGVRWALKEITWFQPSTFENHLVMGLEA